MPITCSMGIMAHNEEANIGPLLRALVTQRLKNVVLTEIVVVAGGVTATQPRLFMHSSSTLPLFVHAARSRRNSAVVYV